MKRTRYIGTIALGMAVLAIPSCTDNWDDHYNSGESTAATQTIWEQIEANPDLSRFVDLASKTVVYKDEEHPDTNRITGTPYTYKDMFNGTQTLTVWAPENSALTQQEHDAWIELSQTNPYRLHQQLMANTACLWSNVATGGGIDTLEMLNGKKMAFDKNKYTMRSIPLNLKNLAATNGTLHTLTSVIPFNYNTYEYIKDTQNARENNISMFNAYLRSNERSVLNENASIQGPIDADGNPTYIDSVTYRYNYLCMMNKRTTDDSPEDNLTYMEGFGANIESEDSDFVLIIPTDNAWAAAYEKLKPLYTYANKYTDNAKETTGASGLYREIPAASMDSFVNQNINMDIISPLCFNAHKQPKPAGAPLWSSKTLLAASDAELSYILNTYGDTLRSDDNFNKTDLWNGKKQLTMSNGVAVVTDSWDFPHKFYQPDVVVEASTSNIYEYSKFLQLKTVDCTHWTNTSTDEFFDTYGRVTNNDFLEFESNSGVSGSADVTFKLVGTSSQTENAESEVMSGTYDICIVVVPDFYADADSVCKHKYTATLTYNNNGKDDSKTYTIKNAKAIEYDGERVDTICLFENVTFPCSYKNMRYCYPTLKLGTASTSSERKQGYNNKLYIDQILLISKESDGSAVRKEY